MLQNIIGQNPDFYVTPTSGLMELVYGARKNFSDVGEFRGQDREISRKGFAAFCNAGLHAYAGALTDKKYYLDKGRSWGFYIDWLEHFLEYQPKIICMVRDLRDVFASMEKLYRRNPDLDNFVIDWRNLANVTISKRIDTFAAGVPIGIAVERLESILQTGKAHKFLFIRYEDFCLRPETEMARVYNYLEVPHYNHNFDFIEQITHEDDTLAPLSDHKIRTRLEMVPSDAKTILGPAICDWIYNRYAWFYQTFKYTK
jgi:sulfotransferase